MTRHVAPHHAQSGSAFVWINANHAPYERPLTTGS